MGCPGGMSTIRYTRSAFTDKGSAVCSSLHCGTRYLIAVLARPTVPVPRWAGSVSGGVGSIRGRFWRSGVPSFRRYLAEPLHCGSVKYRDVVRPLHWPLHYRVRGYGRLKKKMSCIFWMGGNIQEVSNLFTLLVSHQFTRKLYPCSNSCAPTLYISHSI